MACCAFLGDELTALGFRLAGLDCHVPAPGETPALFRRLRGETALLLVTAEAAAELPPELLREARLCAPPLILVIPDIRARVPVPDRAAALRRRLGMAE